MLSRVVTSLFILAQTVLFYFLTGFFKKLVGFRTLNSPIKNQENLLPAHQLQHLASQKL